MARVAWACWPARVAVTVRVPPLAPVERNEAVVPFGVSAPKRKGRVSGPGCGGHGRFAAVVVNSRQGEGGDGVGLAEVEIKRGAVLVYAQALERG